MTAEHTSCASGLRSGELLEARRRRLKKTRFVRCPPINWHRSTGERCLDAANFRPLWVRKSDDWSSDRNTSCHTAHTAWCPTVQTPFAYWNCSGSNETDVCTPLLRAPRLAYTVSQSQHGYFRSPFFYIISDLTASRQLASNRSFIAILSITWSSQTSDKAESFSSFP